MADINLFALSGLLIAVSSGTMACVMLAFSRSRLHILWALFCISVCIWGAGAYFIGKATDPETARLWWQITHVGIAFIPALFADFVHTFVRRRRPVLISGIYMLATFFATASLTSDLLVDQMRFVFDEFYYDSPPALLYPLFTLYFFGLTIFSHYILFRTYQTNAAQEKPNEVEQSKIRYFFMATLVGFVGGGFSFLPVYGIDVYPITNFAVTIYPIIMGYAILRHHLFDIRVATAQGLVFLLWLFAGVRLVVSTSDQELAANLFFFIATLILGLFLVKTINREIEARHRNENLAHDLDKANKRLQLLDRMKSEFVSIASHQLRSPIAAIRGYTSMLQEGDFGKLPTQAKEPLQRINDSARQMAYSIEDYLNISRIESGNMKYDLTDFNLRQEVERVCDDMRPEAIRKGLSLLFRTDLHSKGIVHADRFKTVQIIQNLVNNAIKYTETGHIKVLMRDDVIKKQVFIDVMDTGIGLSQEAVEHLFTKFSRADNASAITGTGLGLYVAKQMAQAMSGDITVSSDGEGKGSCFTVRFPLAL